MEQTFPEKLSFRRKSSVRCPGEPGINDSEAEINQAIERGKSALERAKALAESIPDQTNATLAKAEKSVEKVDSLTASLERLKNEMDAISSKLDHQDNTVGLIASGKGRVNDEIDALVKDTDALIADIKKRGLRLNVDIF